MYLYLEVVSGPRQGKKLVISKRTTVGRTEADLQINDTKLSGVHAVFEPVPGQGWVLTDQKSRNGVFINGIKELSRILKDYDEIQLGSSKMRCRFFNDRPTLYDEEFISWIDELIVELNDQPPSIEEINPAFDLKVTQGPQHGTVWNINYGPRFAGLNHVDLCLFDSKAPMDSFRIDVRSGIAVFSTDQVQKVAINGVSAEEKVLEHGDVIVVGDTTIVVEFS